VNSTNKADEMDAVTGYGKVHVDISAPGETILTTDLVSKGSYKTESGTSLSTPMVASAAALLYSVKCASFYNSVTDDPAGSALKVKEAIMKNTDKKASLINKTVSEGRLNIFRAMNALIEGNCDKELAPKGELSIQQVRYSNKKLSLDYSSPDSKSLELKIYDSIGKLCYTTSITPPVFGDKTATLDIPVELPGIYYFAALIQGSEMSGRGFTSQLPDK
jgi:subtilisin family serine protease